MVEGDFGVLDSEEVGNIHCCTILNRQQEGSKFYIQHKNENTQSTQQLSMPSSTLPVFDEKVLVVAWWSNVECCSCCARSDESQQRKQFALTSFVLLRL